MNSLCIFILGHAILSTLGVASVSAREFELRYGDLGLQIYVDIGAGGFSWRNVGNINIGGGSVACNDYSNSALFYYTRSTRRSGRTVSITCEDNESTISECEIDTIGGMSTVVNVSCLDTDNYTTNSIRVLQDNRVIMLWLWETGTYAWGQVCINNFNTNSIACINILARGSMKENLGFPSSVGFEALELIDFNCVSATTLLSECDFTYIAGTGSCDSANVSTTCATPPEQLTVNTISPTTLTIKPVVNITNSSIVTIANTTNAQTNTTVIPQNTTSIHTTPKNTSNINIIRNLTSSFETPTASSSTTTDPAVISNFPLPILIGAAAACCILLALPASIVCAIILVMIVWRSSKRKVRYKREERQERSSLDYETVDPNLEQEYSNPEEAIHRVISINKRRSNSRYVPLVPIEVLTELEALYSIRSIEPPEEDIYNQVIHQSDMIVPSVEDRQYSNVSDKMDSFQRSENLYLQFNAELPCFIYQNDAKFWEPEDTEIGIYSQMAKKRYREINPSELTRKGLLGEGNFGYVHDGMWRRSQIGEIAVAIKSIKVGDKQSSISLLQEAAILGQFNHPNVLKLLGVVTIGKPMMMVTELMRAGLTDFLDVINNSKSIPLDKMGELFLRFTLEIANGMEHLASKNYVHRDLAARNILVSHNISCKIGDFGLARVAGEEDEYYVSKGGLIPVKWTAPEAILYRKYSKKSDVFSYGVTLFEIWSVGKPPWEDVANEIVAQKVIKGEIMPSPANCPINIYKLMVDCWHPSKDERPGFNEIVSLIQSSTDMLKRDDARFVSHKRRAFKDLQEIYLKSNTVYFDI